MYGVTHFQISRNRYPALFDYCAAMTGKSKNLRNAVLFRIRQHFTSNGKESLQQLQEEVRDEIVRTCEKTGWKMPGRVIPYFFMERLLRITKNPDYFSGLPMQSAQAIAKETIIEFSSWLKALEAYRKDPSSFTGKPKMPGYTKSDHRTVTMTNQDCVVYKGKDGISYLKFPKTKERLNIKLPTGAILKEVKIRPYYSGYEIIAVYETECESKESSGTYAAGIDLGVENIIAFVSNDGESPILYKGGAIKAMNQFYNKAKSKYAGILMKGHDPKEVNVHSARLEQIGCKRSCFINDEMHKISTHVIRECIRRNIGILVIGKNTQWKTNVSMSKKSNQEFVQIPHSTLIHMIRYKAEREGIMVIEQEESYTSKASFLDRDEIPVYGEEENAEYVFSGTRNKRLYRSKNGTVISADINGSANILRKAIPDAFDGMKDDSYLQNVRTVRFRDLHPVRK